MVQPDVESLTAAEDQLRTQSQLVLKKFEHRVGPFERHADVRMAVEQASVAIRASGKRVREDFMKFAWINSVLVAGARQLIG